MINMINMLLALLLTVSAFAQVSDNLVMDLRADQEVTENVSPLVQYWYDASGVGLKERFGFAGVPSAWQPTASDTLGYQTILFTKTDYLSYAAYGAPSVYNSTDLIIGDADWTLEIWLITRPLFTGGYIIGDDAGSASNKGYNMYLYGDGRILFQIADGTGSFWVNKTTAAGAYTRGVLTQFVITLDRDGDQKLYVNGVQKWTQAVSNSVDINSSAYNFLRIGSRVNDQVPFNGHLLRVRIYSGKYFSAADVLTNYNLGVYGVVSSKKTKYRGFNGRNKY